MALMILLTGAIAAMVFFKVTKPWELILLGGWGLLAAGTPIGQPLAEGLTSMSAMVDGLFR
jgi:hypothetical protein